MRKQVGLSQADFASSIGMSPRAYANYERGDREASPAVLLAIWDTYRIDPMWILTSSEQPPPSPDIRYVDTVILQQVHELVEEFLQERKRTLASKPKAQLITFLYAKAIHGAGLSPADAMEALEQAVKQHEAA